MTVKFLTSNRRLTFEINGETHQDIFEGLASIEEVFDSENACGVCKGTAIRYQHRNVHGNDFHELVCKDPTCRARFSFGHAKQPKGALFPKRRRKDDSGNWTGGWEKYTPQGDNNQTGNRQQQSDAAEWE